MAFSIETFQLLEKLHNDPQYQVYKREQKDFNRWLERPFEKLLLDHVAPKLPEAIRKNMKHGLRDRIFGLIMKNDHEGGAWDFYWGAFYPSFSSSKLDDVQLLTFINYKYVEFGFYFGWYCPLERKAEYLRKLRQLRNSKSDYELTIKFLSERLPEDYVWFRDDDYEIDGEDVLLNGFTWSGYFEAASEDSVENVSAYSPMIVYPKDVVLKMTIQNLADEIIAAFEGLFPLAILAIFNDTLPVLRSYIGEQK